MESGIIIIKGSSPEFKERFRKAIEEELKNGGMVMFEEPVLPVCDLALINNFKKKVRFTNPVHDIKFTGVGVEFIPKTEWI